MIDFRKQPSGYEQGIYEMSFDQYRSIPALNSSKLKKMRKSPLHFKTALETPETLTALQKLAFAKGKALDILILEGGVDALKKRVAIEPKVRRNTNEYKDWINNTPADAIILSQEDYLNILAMGSAVNKKQRFTDLFSAGHPHRVLIWFDYESGLWCKAELDWITADGIVVDLKSTADAGFWFFSRNARRLGYLNQAAFYLKGLTTITGFSHRDFRFAACETDPPYESHIFQVESEQLFEAEEDNADWMVTLGNCLENDEFPGYLDEIMSLQSGQYYSAEDYKYFENGDEEDAEELEEINGF